MKKRSNGKRRIRGQTVAGEMSGQTVEKKPAHSETPASAPAEGRAHPERMSPHTVDLTLIACLSRLCQLLSRIVRDQGKRSRITPEQIRMLLYLRNATPGVATVKDLARTFLVTHSAVSESLTALVKRGFVRRIRTGPGKKARLVLTRRGRSLTERLSAYSIPLKEAMDSLESAEKMRFLYVMLKIIRGLQERRLLPPTRLCLNCVHFHPNQFEQADEPHHCDDYGIALATGALRLECPEYLEAPEPVWRKNWEAVIRGASEEFRPA
jgi:DNA-binding MarR family transcriptional regulator